jgi:hypothetical protein
VRSFDGDTSALGGKNSRVLAEDLHSFIEDLPLVRTRNNDYNLRRILSTRVFAAV